MQVTPVHNACTYTACYCEENVYLLLQQLTKQQQHAQLFAVFISNANEQVPFWHQRAGHGGEGFVVWDYHVIVLECPVSTADDGQPQPQPLIWDLDLQHPSLGFPCSLQQYAQHALRVGTVQLPHELKRMYRLVPAAAFLQHFASDRSHMRRPDGSWLAQPPQYPCIAAADGTRMNLLAYRDMSVHVLHDSIQQNSSSAVQESARCQQQQHHHLQQQPHGQQQQQQQEAHGYSNVNSMHVHSQRQQVAVITSKQPMRKVGWQDVLRAACADKYGVVVQEDTLLRCLLGEGSYNEQGS